MSSAPFEIIAGPANVFTAPTGTTMPVVGTVPTTPWVDMGYTDGGVSVQTTQSITEFMVDQIATPVKTLRSAEGVIVTFAIAQLTLERIALVYNNASVTTATGPPATKAFYLQKGTSVQTYSMLVRGPSPYGDFNMQFELPIVYQSENPTTAFTRDGMATMSTQWTSLADTSKVVGQQFGRLIAQTA
jgi:hypothetical protein